MQLVPYHENADTLQLTIKCLRKSTRTQENIVDFKFLRWREVQGLGRVLGYTAGLKLKSLKKI